MLESFSGFTYLQSSVSITQALEATPDLSLFSSTPVPPQPVGKNVEDLFSAHDFDIQIDLPSTPEGWSLILVFQCQLWPVYF